MSVRDNGSPARFAQVNAFVTINVIRNNFVPQFVSGNCNRDLSQNTAIFTSVTQVSATDGDAVVRQVIFLFLSICYFFLKNI